MEWFIDTHSKKHLLVPDIAPHTDDEVVCRRFEIALGTPASVVASSDRRARISMIGTNKRRMLVESGSKFILAATHKNYTINTETTRSALVRIVIDPIHKNGLHEQAKGQTRNGGNSSEHSTKVIGVQILEKFKAITIDDLPQLNFGYISFWTTCAGLVGRMRAKMHPHMSKKGSRTSHWCTSARDAFDVRSTALPTCSAASRAIRIWPSCRSTPGLSSR